MAAAERESSTVLVSAPRRSAADGLAAGTSRVLWAAGILFFLGGLADLFLLWGMQRIPNNPVWEFQALSNTLEGTPRIVLAVALLWLALHVRGTMRPFWQRSFAVVCLVLGLLGAVLGAMMLSDYFVLRGNLPPAESRIFNSAVLKTLTLSALHLVLLVPVGVMGLRNPR